MRFQLGELFCGAGGLAWGAINATQAGPITQADESFDIAHTWANDIDASACKTYAANIILNGAGSKEDIQQSVVNVPEWRRRISEKATDRMPSVVCGSVTDLTQHLADLPLINAFAFGFPCNDFSAVGERKGMDGDFGPLYQHGIAVIKHFKPRWFIAENVEGLVHRNHGKVFAQIRHELETAGDGYDLTPHLYRFEEYGVPQFRTRLVIVGISKPDAEKGIVFRVPAPTTAAPYRSAQWAMTHEAMAPDVYKPLTIGENSHKIKRISDRVKQRLNHTLPGQNAWNAAIPEEFALHVKKAHLSMIYRRLKADQPAYTITGNGGGGTHGYHWKELRALTNRERARLQSFPDSFGFQGGEDSIRKQIGMAVPPLAAQIIFRAILQTYARVAYPSVDATINRTRRQPQLTLTLDDDTATAPA